MRKATLAVWAASIVVLGSSSARAEDFCINSTLQGGGSRNFSVNIMSVSGSFAALTLIDRASVNAIGFGALHVSNVFLAPITLSWTVVADGTTENYDCRLFPSLSGTGNLLTVRNVGTTRVQLSPCTITPPPC